MAGKKAKKDPRKINKQELVSAKSGLSKAHTRKAVDGIIHIIKEAPAAGDSVSLINFSSFKTVERKAGTGRNLQTGKKMKIKARTAPKLVPGKGLKEAVK